MTTFPSRPRVAVASLAFFIVGTGLMLWVKAGPADLTTELGGPDRYLTHVDTDKPIYRPGEKLYVRATVLRADTHAALPADQQSNARIEIHAPTGETVATGSAPSQDSVVAFAWDIPEALSGGEYKVVVSHPFTGYVPGERKFDVRAYRAPRLKTQTVFLRDGYGPGDAAAATLHVDRAEGGIPEGAKVTVVARVDGAEVHRSESRVDKSGNCSARFALPSPIARGEGTLVWIIEDGGVVETATKTIPILLQTVDLSLYPEGGDLVSGLPSRIYLEAFTPAHKPADLAGVVVDSHGFEVTKFRTEHEGRGRFEIKPQAGESYSLKITEPAGIKTTYPLPAVKPDGVTLRTSGDVFGKNEPVKLTVAAVHAGKFKVTLAKREVEIASLPVEINGSADTREVTLTPPASADGVLVATVYDAAGKPLAERLIYRQPAKGLHVKLTPDRPRYAPGDPVRLTLATTDDDGKPVSAVVGVSVTDDSVREMIEKREQAPRLPVMVLLEPEVRELADAAVYLDAENPKAPLATDLLLGTQGWRRFAMVNREKFVVENGEAARRVLALKVVTEREALREDELRGGEVFAEAGARRAGGAVQLKGAAKGEGAKNLAGFSVLAAPAAMPAPAAVKAPVAVDGAEGGRQAPQEQRGAGQGRFRAALDATKDKLESRQLRKQLAEPARNDFVVVREYAHVARPDRRPDDRTDFTETLYWQAGVRTDASSGTATVSFATSDAVTSFHVSADAFTQTGTLGAGTTKIESVKPFYVEPKLPLEVTSGDILLVPVSVVNQTQSELNSATLIASGKGLTLSPIDPFTLKAGSRERRMLKVQAGVASPTLLDLVIEARGGDFHDSATRKLSVRPLGFPVELAIGGMLDPKSSITYTIEIPPDVVPGSVASNVAVYPTPLANMTEALKALIQSPCGCFEQTSSTTYPLIMAQQYFTSHTGVDPALVEQSRALLTDGYNRLTAFECKQSKGFEWFGADPGHEALSAYGLLEFTDMARVRDVDPRMLADTRAYVMKCRDGKGGFKRERATLHTWINDPDCSNGYITWALLECGQTGIGPEVKWLKEAALKSNNSYVIALGANAMFLAGEQEAYKTLAGKLAAKQAKDGSVAGATTSVVGSEGESLQVETTALAAMAWLRQPAYAAQVEQSMQWLAAVCKAGRFGSTQSTVLALRAIVAYDKARAHPKAAGSLELMADGKPVGGKVVFDADTQSAIKLPDLSEILSPGKHTIELKMNAGSSMPYAISVQYNQTKPVASEKCKVGISVSLADKEVAEGNVTEATVKVTNRTGDAVPTPIAIVGIPGGLEPRHDQLKELVKAGKIDAYEVRGREVVLYWRELKAHQAIELPVSLIAAIPGTYTAPASRAYLYYADEFKDWTPALQATVTPIAK